MTGEIKEPTKTVNYNKYTKKELIQLIEGTVSEVKTRLECAYEEEIEADREICATYYDVAISYKYVAMFALSLLTETECADIFSGYEFR